jgi:hypothetical protein
MTPKSKGLWMLGITFFLTLLVTLFKQLPQGHSNGNWLIWFFCAWNFFAYAFDRNMWPWVFAELYGRGKGKPGVRKFHFWGTTLLYLSFLALIAFASE